MNVLLTTYITNKIRIYFLPYVFILFFSCNAFAIEDNEHGFEERIELSENEIKEFEIKIDTAGSGIIKETLTVPGEITLDPDHLIHIVPRVSGITKNVHKTLGDRVEEGELLATLSSRELISIIECPLSV